MSNARHSSEHTEHYTPPEVVAVARATMGGIDLDPATSELANQTVQAERIFTMEHNGFLQAWSGRVMHNPPGGSCDDTGRTVIRAKRSKSGEIIREDCTVTGDCGLLPGHEHRGVSSSQKAWWFKLAKEWTEGRVEQALFVCFSIELFQTSQVDTPAGVPLPLDFPFCLPSRRLAYYAMKEGKLVRGGSPTHASALIYLPPRFHDRAFATTAFRLACAALGRVVVPEQEQKLDGIENGHLVHINDPSCMCSFCYEDRDGAVP
jgi:hypothetical protein